MSGADLLTSAIAAAMVVVSGGLYALFLALWRLKHSERLRVCAWACYAALAVFTFLLAGSLELGGGWLIVIAVMLGGYLLAPTAIWHLTRATHGDGRESEGSR